MTTYVKVMDETEEDGYYVCDRDDAPDTVRYGENATAADFTAVSAMVLGDEAMFGTRWARRPKPKN